MKNRSILLMLGGCTLIAILVSGCSKKQPSAWVSLCEQQQWSNCPSYPSRDYLEAKVIPFIENHPDLDTALNRVNTVISPYVNEAEAREARSSGAVKFSQNLAWLGVIDKNVFVESYPIHRSFCKLVGDRTSKCSEEGVFVFGSDVLIDQSTPAGRRMRELSTLCPRVGLWCRVTAAGRLRFVWTDDERDVSQAKIGWWSVEHFSAEPHTRASLVSATAHSVMLEIYRKFSGESRFGRRSEEVTELPDWPTLVSQLITEELRSFPADPMEKR